MPLHVAPRRKETLPQRAAGSSLRTSRPTKVTKAWRAVYNGTDQLRAQ